MELMDKANVFVFDKTGTLTKGVFEVVDVKSDLPNDEVLKIAAIAEKTPITRSPRVFWPKSIRLKKDTKPKKSPDMVW